MRKKIELRKLKNLGKSTTYSFDKISKKKLEFFNNKFSNNDYVVRFEQNGEFTSLCPKTGQPDHGNIVVYYKPDLKCIESKSLKLYLMSYRNTGSFGEDITNQICEDIYDVVKPKWIRVIGVFRIRGGISWTVEVIKTRGTYRSTDDKDRYTLSQENYRPYFT